jgi:hypothetical protein
MRKLAFIIAAFGALAVTAPAYAAGNSSGAVQTERAVPAQSRQADEFSSRHRRHWRHHRHHHRHWHRRHYRPRYYSGWNRCRSVWRPHRGWVRICRW